MERREKIYSLHRYIDENGAPDLEKIFSRKESQLKRHLNLGLKKIWHNQPDVVQKKIEEHLGRCDSCKNDFE
ncbi:MAG: hypothetical protein HY505_02430 [Candidatus Yanofskybacteria bacterium]|nr:hypothetical protein [Candidatus Yanofskybacteria bacterium]